MNGFDGFIVGVLWALQFLGLVHLLSGTLAKKVLISTMWFVVGLFLVNQLMEIDFRGILLEGVMFSLQVALIFFAKRYDFRFLALAFFVHGSWDLFHLFNPDFIHKSVLFSQICVPYDWSVAAYICWRSWKD
jgi:hypothetical protein